MKHTSFSRAGVSPVGAIVILASALADVVSAQTPAVRVDAATEARALMSEPVIEEAFRVIVELDPRTVEDHIALTQIPAPPFKEAERAQVYLEWLRDAGADSVFIDEEGNVIALRRGRTGERTVGFGGHLDTVFPEGTDVTVQQRGDTLFAPGIGDNTRGLMVVLTVLRAMEQAGVETEDDVWFVGVVGEEGLGDLRGMKHLFGADTNPIAAWIDVDGLGLDRTVNRGLGSYRYRVAFKGPGGHSWGAFGIANPAHALGRAVTHFVAAADPLTRSGPRTSYNVGSLDGGTSVNAVPFEAIMEIDMRSEDPASLDRIDLAFKEAMQRGLDDENKARRRGPTLELVVEPIGNRPSGAVPDDAPLVRRALATSEILGVPGSLAIASTNSNIPIALGIPAVTIGGGGVGEGAHSPDEWWINRDGHLGIQRALLLLVAEAGLALGDT